MKGVEGRDHLSDKSLAKERKERAIPMARTLLVLALLCLTVGPAVALLGGGWGAGVLIFCAGVVLFGVRSLLEGGDRAVGLVMIAAGSMAAVADLVRLLL